jgi:hypothetical protein
MAFQFEQVGCRVGHRTVLCYVTSLASIKQHHILETHITWRDIALAREIETESLTVVSSMTTASIYRFRIAPCVLTFRGLLQNRGILRTVHQSARRHVRRRVIQELTRWRRPEEMQAHRMGGVRQKHTYMDTCKSDGAQASKVAACEHAQRRQLT